MAASLNGKVVAFLESRMQSEMAGLIERHGGTPYSAPVLQEIYLKDSPEVRQLIQDVCAEKVHVVVLLTGVGTQALVETAASMGLEQDFLRSLNTRTIIARSPKPAGVLRRHKIHIDVMPPEPYTSQDLIQAIVDIDLSGKEVAVQAYGGPNNFLSRSLQEKGANVREVTLYSWGLPDDTEPVLQLIDDLALGKIDAVAFTSQPQIENLLTVAALSGKEESLRKSLDSPSLTIASIGPVCSRKLGEKNIKIDVEPEHVHMGNLIIALAEHLGPDV
jgi:uroporphyrinogen-III synthase